VFSFLRQLTVWHCTHLLLLLTTAARRPCSKQSIYLLAAGPTAANPLQRCGGRMGRRDRRTDRRTTFASKTLAAPYTVHALPIKLFCNSVRCFLFYVIFDRCSGTLSARRNFTHFRTQLDIMDQKKVTCWHCRARYFYTFIRRSGVGKYRKRKSSELLYRVPALRLRLTDVVCSRALCRTE